MVFFKKRGGIHSTTFAILSETATILCHNVFRITFDFFKDCWGNDVSRSGHKKSC